jgi:putative cardiolipin synthase
LPELRSVRVGLLHIVLRHTSAALARLVWCAGVLLWLCSATLRADTPTLANVIARHCPDCAQSARQATGAYILEYGEESLVSRAWLTQHATRSIDVQYFIWSTDNIGILASEALLAAAERGVKVRVIVDDFLLDVDEQTLLALAAHPNVEIRIYNPQYSVGTSALQRIWRIATAFRRVNQRMHDKTAIFDNQVGITGGRNMADEYFDYDHAYNFRDRDVLLLGSAVDEMTQHFETFWQSPLAVPVEQLLDDTDRMPQPEQIRAQWAALHAYAERPENFEPAVRQMLASLPTQFPTLVQHVVWGEAQFLGDEPGKNSRRFSLGGGGQTTSFLAQQLAAAQQSVLIQSPYLVMPDGGIELLQQLVQRGVRVRVSTNSLASTDNLMAFSGYQKQRQRLLEAGVELYEFRPDPAVQLELLRRYPRLQPGQPVFALHAKSMVIDQQRLFIGTFNLDPRSAHLNTEVGLFMDSTPLAAQLASSIERDMQPENSWQTTREFNPDREVPLVKRVHAGFYRALPLSPVL